jgi:hypothetical protein
VCGSACGVRGVVCVDTHARTPRTPHAHNTTPHTPHTPVVVRGWTAWRRTTTRREEEARDERQKDLQPITTSRPLGTRGQDILMHQRMKRDGRNCEWCMYRAKTERPDRMVHGVVPQPPVPPTLPLPSPSSRGACER